MVFLSEFSILLLIIVAVSFAVKLLRQPIIIGYVLSGLLFAYLAGTLAQPLVSRDSIILMSELGITFLLFLMGLELDLKSFKYLGKDILLATLVQSAAFFAGAFAVARFFGFSSLEGVYIGVLFMFSSTLLVAKWLEDKKETDTFHGKVVISTLIIQDVLAIIALTVLTVQEPSFVSLLTTPLKGLLLIGLTIVLARFALNTLLAFASRYPELLFILSLGVCFLFVEIAPLLGYSAAIGAFLGGITLANTSYKTEVITRLRPLIVFFNMLFFVGLGFQMDLSLDSRFFFLIAVLVLLSLLLKPLVIYGTLRWRNYDARSSFLSSLHLSQMSEFGMIIAAAGVLSGAVSAAVGSLAVIGVILTMIASSYLIKYDRVLYRHAERFLPQQGRADAAKPIIPRGSIVIFGYHHLGKEILSLLKKEEKKITVVDNDPEHIAFAKHDGLAYIYASIHHPEFLERLNFTQAELVLSMLTDFHDNATILQHAKGQNPKAVVIATVKSAKDALELYRLGTDYIVYPLFVHHQHLNRVLREYLGRAEIFAEIRPKHTAALGEWERKKKQARQSVVWDFKKLLRRKA